MPRIAPPRATRRRDREPRAVGACGLRQAEVEHLHRAVRRDLDVRGLQVAVDDALLVRGLERVGNLPRDRQRLGDRRGRVHAAGSAATRDPLRERLALDQLEDQAAHAVRLFDAVDRADVRMIQRGEHPRLALEAREPIRVGRERGGRTLIATSRPSVASCAR